MTRSLAFAQLDYGSQGETLCGEGCDADFALTVQCWYGYWNALTDRNSLVAGHNGWSLLFARR